MTAILITGNSSGLGLGLSELALGKGWQVYGCSRRGCPLEGVADQRCDLSALENIPAALEQLLGGVRRLERVVLNAGILGEIKPMAQTSQAELDAIMAINVWANKAILDWLLQAGIAVEQIVAISSGAAVLGNKGWSGYALSKASLNMLLRLYAHEFPSSHLSTIAPGLIDSAIMDYLCVEPDTTEYPALERIRQARGTDAMPGPQEAARRVWEVLPRLREFESGSFVDIRQLIAPEEYAALMR